MAPRAALSALVLALALIACGSVAEPAPDDAGGDALEDGRRDACAPSPVRYACDVDGQGRVWWSLTEGCKTARYECTAQASPHCAPCAGDAGSCWRCADRALRNVCVVPAEVAPDADSCARCGERCSSVDGG